MTEAIQAEYARPSELKKIFGLSRAEVYRRLTAKDFTARKVGACVYVDLATVRDFLKRSPVATFRPPASDRSGRPLTGVRRAERAA